jgi:hypothetical protein
MNPPQWARLKYSNSELLSIHREETGQLLVGTSNGEIWEIEDEFSDDGSLVDIEIVTPWHDDANPMMRKDAADLQIHCDTGLETGTVELFKDGQADATTTLTTLSSEGPGVYRANLEDFGTFLRAGMRISGSFRTFLLHGFGLSYRSRPQQVMVLDTGFIIPPNDGDLVWLTEVEIDTWSPANLLMKVYKDGSLFDTATIPVTPNSRDVYRVNTIRNTKGRRLRIVFTTTNPDGPEDQGFEPYRLRARHKGAGNLTELPFGSGDQGNL